MLPTTTEVFEKLNKSLDKKILALTNINQLNQDMFEARKNMMHGKNRILNEYNDVVLHPDGQKELGANEAARNAAIDAMLTKEKTALEEIEVQLTQAQGELQVVLVECDRWRYALRILEVNAGTEFSVTAR